MKRERNPVTAVTLAWQVSAAMARREPYRTEALPPLRRSAAFMDAVPEFAWATRGGFLWRDPTGSLLVAYPNTAERRRSWWLFGVTFALVFTVVMTAAAVAWASGINELVVYVTAVALLVVGMGGNPVASWRRALHGSALARYRHHVGPHTYISFVYRPAGRVARSPLEMAAELQHRGELVGPYLVRAATPAHARLYRRYGFETLNDAPTTPTGLARLMLRTAALPNAPS